MDALLAEEKGAGAPATLPTPTSEKYENERRLVAKSMKKYEKV